MMLLSGLKFHHNGLAVRNNEKATIWLESLGYSASEVVYDPEQDVNLQLFTLSGSPTFELVMPGKSADGPLASILSRYEEMIYHTCYEVEDLDATLAEIRGLGLRVMTVSERKPAVLFGGRHVSFYKIAGFGIVEFLEPV